MTQTGIVYKRFPGRGPRRDGIFSSVLSRCRLYLGPDHILTVESNGFSEEYKRFYFTDIQALVLRKTPRWIVFGSIQFLTALISFGLGLSARAEPLRIFWLVVTVVCLVLLVFNLLKGPTCVCRISTAVQEDTLPSINRVWIARKVIDGTLKPLIEGAQGALQPDDPALAHDAGVATRWREPLKTSVRGTETDGPQGYRGAAHIFAFSLLLSAGLLTGIDLLRQAPSITIMSYLVSMAAAVLLVAALVKQRGGAISGGARRAAWTSLIFVSLSLMLGYGIALVGTVKARRPFMTEWDIYSAMLHVSPKNSSFVMAVFIFQAAGALITAVVGLVFTLKHRAGRPADSPRHIGEVVYKA